MGKQISAEFTVCMWSVSECAAPWGWLEQGELVVIYKFNSLIHNHCKYTHVALNA